MVNIFIYSPFQALCACQYVKQCNLKDIFFYVISGVNQKNIIYLTESVLIDFNYEYTLLSFNSYIELCRFKFDKVNISNLCIIGDYLSPVLTFLALKSINKNGEFIYLDDGNSTLGIFEGSTTIFNCSFRNSIKWIYPYILKKIKIKKELFFSLYECKNKRFSVINNNFSEIIHHYRSDSRARYNGLFILGTNYKLFFSVEDYLYFLNKVLLDLNYNKYDGVYYCPHRAELNDPEITNFCSQKGIHYHIPRGCVEVDFLVNNVSIECLVSFGSSATFTLNKIFPDTKSYIYKLPYNKMKKNIKDNYDAYYHKMQEYGIIIKSI